MCFSLFSKFTKIACQYLYLFRSVVSLTNSYGELLNSYSYEAFGSVTRKTEKVINDFLFIGQWGAISSEEVPNLCYMRARFYDAEEGRFMSIDPISFRGRSHNLYVYANNNPKSFVDPKGTIVPILVPGFIGAVVNAAVYGITETFFGNGPTKAGMAND